LRKTHVGVLPWISTVVEERRDNIGQRKRLTHDCVVMGLRKLLYDRVFWAY